MGNRRSDSRGTGLAALALATVLGASACATTGDVVQNSATQPLRIPDGGLTQTFVARSDRLSRFTVTTGTYGVEHPNVVLRLVVRAEDGTEHEALLDGSDIGDVTAAEFVFPWFEDSAGGSFTAALTISGSDPVAVFINPHDPYPDGALTPGPGDLTFELGHAGRASGTLAALVRVPAEFGRNLGSDPLFTLGWLLALGAGITGLVRVGRRRSDAPRDTSQP